MKVKPFVSSGSTAGYWVIDQAPGFMAVKLASVASPGELRWCVRPNPNALVGPEECLLLPAWRSQLPAQRFATLRDALQAFEGFLQLNDRL